MIRVILFAFCIDGTVSESSALWLLLSFRRGDDLASVASIAGNEDLLKLELLRGGNVLFAGASCS